MIGCKKKYPGSMKINHLNILKIVILFQFLLLFTNWLYRIIVLLVFSWYNPIFIIKNVKLRSKLESQKITLIILKYITLNNCEFNPTQCFEYNANQINRKSLYLFFRDFFYMKDLYNSSQVYKTRWKVIMRFDRIW